MSLVLTVRENPVASLETVTSAPTMAAPVLSRTVPCSAELAVACPAATPATLSSMAEHHAAIFIRYMYLLLEYCPVQLDTLTSSAESDSGAEVAGQFGASSSSAAWDWDIVP